MNGVFLADMDKGKFITLSVVVLKVIFLIGTLIIYFLGRNYFIDNSRNIIWRDFNEFSCYFFILLVFIELFTKQFFQVFFTVICIAFCLYFWQSVTGWV